MGPMSQLVGVVDAVCGADPTTLADGEAIEALFRRARPVGGGGVPGERLLRRRREWQADGARGAGAWIATRRRMPMSAGRRRVLLGRALRHLPETEQAWLAGDIGIAQVSMLAEARTPRTEEALARDEAMLVGQAKELQHRHFAKAMAYSAQLADPDGAEGQAKLNHERRKLHLSQSWEGQWYLDGIFDAIGGEILNQEPDQDRDRACPRRLGRGQGPGGRQGVPFRAASYPGSAPGRRPRGDGPALGRRPGRFPPARAAVQRGGRLRDLPAHLRARPGERCHPWQPGSLARPGLGTAGCVRRIEPGQEHRGAPAAVHRRHSGVGAAAGTGVLPYLLRHPRL